MFSEDTRDVSGAMVSFESLPSKALLTLGMDAPESWLVESVRSPYDLDNIYLEEVRLSSNYNPASDVCIVYVSRVLDNQLLNG